MKERGRIKIRKGVVVSDKPDKAIVIRIDRIMKHPKYKKTMKVSSQVMVHDEKNEAKTGDKVKVREVRALSKNKRWRLMEVLK